MMGGLLAIGGGNRIVRFVFDSSRVNFSRGLPLVGDARRAQDVSV